MNRKTFLTTLFIAPLARAFGKSLPKPFPYPPPHSTSKPVKGRWIVWRGYKFFEIDYDQSSKCLKLTNAHYEHNSS